MLAGRALHTTRSCPRRARPLSGKGGEGSLKVGWQHRTVASGPCCSFWRRRGALKVGALALVRLPLCGCVGGEAYLRVRPARLFKEFSPLPTWSPPGGGCAGCGGARVGIALSAGSRAPACPLSGVGISPPRRGRSVCSLGGCLLLFGCYASVFGRASPMALCLCVAWHAARVWVRALTSAREGVQGWEGWGSVFFCFNGSIACVSLCPSPDSSGMPAAL